MPLARRVPKRGFVNGAFKKFYAIVNLDDLEARFEAGAVVDEAALRAKGLVKGHEFDGIKILGDGTLTKALEVHATKFSGSAAEKIAAVGGKTIAVPYTRRTAKAASPEIGRASAFIAGRGPKPKSPLLAIGGPAMSYGRVTPGSGLRAARFARSQPLPAAASVD